MNRTYKIALWSLFGVLVIALLYLVNTSWKNSFSKTPQIIITEEAGMSFLTKSELLLKLRRASLWDENLRFSDLNASKIEDYIRNLNEVEHVQVFLNLNKTWQIEVKTRRPIVRILPRSNAGFYIDDKGEHMSIAKYPAQVIVATGLDNLSVNDLSYSKLINNDSLITKTLSDDIYRISSYVCNDAFFDAQLTQIHYEKENGFILIPRIGNHTIIFGLAPSAEEVEQKFKKLKLFYKEVIPFEGWNKYKTIDLRFDKQIVGKKN